MELALAKRLLMGKLRWKILAKANNTQSILPPAKAGVNWFGVNWNEGCWKEVIEKRQ